jgi:hypothetical protein
MASVASFFSDSYAEAREKFLKAAETAGAEFVESIPHPMKGPDGGALATDIAWIGPRSASKRLLLTSSTHGIEGYCGSGCQVSWLENRHYDRDASPDTAVILVHAINPHGFAHGRRVTEDNVDLNRNFLDFSKPLPVNADYAALQEHVNPKEWSPEALARADQAIAAYYKMPNTDFLPRAVHGGQYVNDKGTYFGGFKPTWSNATLRSIVMKYLVGASDACVIDYHTGLGPLGHGDMMYGGRSGEGMARQWFDHITPTEEELKAERARTGTGHRANAIPGTLSQSIVEMLPDVKLTSGGIEYGTHDIHTVLKSLRADNWVYTYGDPASPFGRETKALVREMFYPSVFEWKIMVASRSNDVIRQALTGLARA